MVNNAKVIKSILLRASRFIETFHPISLINVWTIFYPIIKINYDENEMKIRKKIMAEIMILFLKNFKIRKKNRISTVVSRMIARHDHLICLDRSMV